MKYFFLLGCLLGLCLLVTPFAQAQTLNIQISPTSSGTYSVYQSLTALVKGGTAGTTYDLTGLASSTATTPMTAVTIVNPQTGTNTVAWQSGQTEAVFEVRFLPGSEGDGRVLLIKDTETSSLSGELTIIPAPVLTLSPASGVYSEGQSVTVTMTGGLPGQDYLIKLYSSLPPGIANDLSGEITPSTSQNTINTISWGANTTSAQFYIRLDKTSEGANRYLVATNLDFSHLGVTQPFDIKCVAKAEVTRLSATANLGSGNCSVRIEGQAKGNIFTVTGPDGYVFSNVHRETGNYPVFANGITKPGTYTLTATYSTGCGTNTVVQTVEVTGTACK